MAPRSSVQRLSSGGRGASRAGPSLGGLGSSLGALARDAASCRKPSAAKFRLSLTSSGSFEEPSWQVGGRYAVDRAVSIYGDPELQCKCGSVRTDDTVLLLALKQEGGQGHGTLVGFVVPPQPGQPGWVTLEDPPGAGRRASGAGPLLRARLEGSWEIGARYAVKSAATVRAGVTFCTEVVAELTPGTEVIVLDLAVGQNEPAGDLPPGPRLRAQVSLPDGAVGWLSPETRNGECLLFPVNLLGPKVVDVHRLSRKIVAASSTGSTGLISSKASKGLLSAKSSLLTCTDSAFQLGSEAPWEVGRTYRTLEPLGLRLDPALTSGEMARVPAGELVTVQELHNVECARLGWCPCAFVVVESEEGGSGVIAGQASGWCCARAQAPEPLKGWVRCIAQDGHQLLDTRDQHEHERVLERLRSEEALARASELERAPAELAAEAEPQQQPVQAAPAKEEGASPPARQSPKAKRRGQRHRSKKPWCMTGCIRMVGMAFAPVPLKPLAD